MSLLALSYLSYLCLGAAIAAGMMMVPSLSSGITTVARRMSLPLRYARTLWIIGTMVAWPVGLYVLVTGRLVLSTRGHARERSISRSSRPMHGDNMASLHAERYRERQDQHT